jgi:hypothetical protein
LTAVEFERPSVVRLGVEWISLEDCRSGIEPYPQLIKAYAHRYDVEPRALSTRALLQLPRVVDVDGRLNLDVVEKILSKCARQLSDDLSAVGEFTSDDRVPVGDLDFVELRPADAGKIFDHLHYLRNARPGSRNYALVHPLHRYPITLCSVSPLDWALVGRQLERQFGIPPERVLDVSRVYSFDVAPGNAISALLSQVRLEIRRTAPNVELLTTAVDPNLGFTGTSYRAANWQHWISVRSRPYLYSDGSYVTPRQLRSEFGTSNLADIRSLSGRRFETSRVRLLDSLIFCSRTTGETEQVKPADRRLLRR